MVAGDREGGHRETIDEFGAVNSSASGHKQIWRQISTMSALPPKVDIRRGLLDGRIVPDLNSRVGWESAKIIGRCCGEAERFQKSIAELALVPKRWVSAATKEWQITAVQELSKDMRKMETRPGMSMAYQDHWFGEPWNVPETVVMVHGNSESSHAWTCWVPHFARHYRVVRPDLPGFGATPEPAGYGWSANELATDIGLLLDVLKIETCHLIGAKYGGSACIRLAIDQPHRLSSLCLFGSPVRGSGSGNADLIRTKGVRQWAADTMRSRLGSAASEAQLKWWTDELMGKTGARAAYGASSSRIDMELQDELPGITAPTLIVTTQESGLQSVAAVERYARMIPKSTVIVLPGDSYHIAAVEPDLCAQHALQFIQQVSATHARADE